MLQILAFLASGPGGALIGIFIKILGMWLDHQKEKRQAKRDERIAELEQISEYQKQVHAGHKGHLKEVSRDIKIWGIHLQWNKWKTFSSQAYSPYSFVVSMCVLYLTAVLGAAVLALIYFGDTVLITLDPTGASTDRSFLYGLFTWSVATKTYVLTAAGAALYLLALINFTVTAAVIGTHRRK